MTTSMPKLPLWIRLWCVISSAVVLWDVAFVLLRPMSMAGGSLAFIWVPYQKYVTIDHSYADLENGFVRAQALMSLLEIAVLAAGLAAHRRGANALATLLVFAVSTLTAAKTLLILLIEGVTGLSHVGHNPPSDLVWMYLVPNGIWVVVPLIVAAVAGRRLLVAARG